MSNNVLIVDDAAFMRVMIKDLLSKQGFTVVGEAENGIQAIDRYKELKPDLVIMDVAMPLMNGIEAVKSIKNINSSAVIIICAAMNQQSTVVEAIEAGAVDFIIKPLETDRFVSAIENALIPT